MVISAEDQTQTKDSGCLLVTIKIVLFIALFLIFSLGLLAGVVFAAVSDFLT